MATFRPEDYGVVLNNGVHDDAPAIQAAINAAGAGGGTVTLEPLVYGVGTPLVQSFNGVVIEGGGGAWPLPDLSGFPAAENGTLLKAVAGFPAGGMLTVAPPAGPLRLRGTSMRRVSFDCSAGLAAAGVVLKSLVDFDYDNLVILSPSYAALIIGVVPPGTLTADVTGMQYGRIGRIFAATSPSNAPYGVLVIGDNTANPCLFQIENLSYWHKDGTALEFRSSDSIQVVKASGYREAGGTGTAVLFSAGTQTVDYPRNITIGSLQAGPGGCRSKAGVTNPRQNKILDWMLGNGSPAGPVVDAGTSLTVVS